MMMERSCIRFCIRVLTLVEFSILCLLILVPSASAQEGFVSLACCSDSNYIDSSTNISWISDYSWFSDQKTCTNISTPILINNNGNNKSRVFDIPSGKRCYNLNTTKDQEYLIRGTFVLGDSGTVKDHYSSFSVYVGVTELSEVNSSQEFVEVEGIFIATRNYIDFCLEKRQEGDPYITNLELRPLIHDLGYLLGFSGVLKVVARVDVENNTSLEIRNPDDPSDRIWRPPSNPNPTYASISTPNANITNFNGIVRVPLRVLQTALTHSNELVFLHTDLDTELYEYRVIFYFLELNNTVNPGERLLDIYINDKKEESNFDIWANGSNYREAVFIVRSQGSLNLRLLKTSNGSELGPICNAYEILQVRPWVQETNERDVEVILKVRDELLGSNPENELLNSWSGDPCLPSPWDCLACGSINGFPVITKLDLSSRNFKGSFPSDITELAYLKNLNLSHNNFRGEIPSFPTSSMLISMDLSYNDFKGLPESLASLPFLERLNLVCNPQLPEELPLSFNTSRVSIDHGKCDRPRSTYPIQGIVIGTVACGSVLFAIIVGIIYVGFCRQKFILRGKFNRNAELIMQSSIITPLKFDDDHTKPIHVETFKLEYIEAVTQNYKTLIGEGGFGAVYRGTLTDGREVAVKVRSATSTQGTREFDNELKLLTSIQHENLVPLLGFCRENEQEILVYPFMSNGSLQDRLYGELANRKILDWPTRLSIALGAARGLTYLHTHSGGCVVHRDVKSSNILLDHSMCAKVADFGFWKYAPQEGDSGASLEVRGTAGYLDPEYYTTHHLSAKSDVFSFGVVLLEIISGREPLNIHRPHNEWSLVEWAKPYIRESKIDEIVDPSIRGAYHAEAMWRVVEVALACIEQFSTYRPCMADIVLELEDALIIENNASEYMRSIDSFGGSNHFSIVVDKKMVQPPTPSPTKPLPITQDLAPPEPR